MNISNYFNSLKLFSSLLLILLLAGNCGTEVNTNDDHAPSNFSYSPSVVDSTVGESGSSGIPNIDDGGEAVVFNISNGSCTVYRHRYQYGGDFLDQ